MGGFKKWMIGAAVFFTLFTAIGFLVVPPILKAYLLENISKTLKRKVSIHSVGLNPYTLTLSLRGIGIGEPKSEEDFVSLGELAVNLSIRTVFRRAPVIEEITLRKPYVHLVRNRDNTYNFSDLLALMKIVVREDDLRLLATERAEMVSDAIREQGEFEAGWIFVVEPKTLEPEAKKDVKKSRVDFRLT